MKRKLTAIFAAIVVALTLVASCSIEVKPVEKEVGNTEKAVVNNEEEEVVIVDDESNYYKIYLLIIDDYYSGEDMKLSAYMAAVKDAEKFTYATEDSDYGAFLSSVNGRAADSSKHEFWSFYTSNSEYNGEFGDNYEYNGTTLYPASLGMDSLPVKTGETIMFILMTW